MTGVQTCALPIYFFFRKIVRDNGATLMTLGSEIKAFCESGGALADEKAKLLKALGDFQGIVTTLVGYAMASQSNPKEIYKVGLNTSRALFAAGDVVVGWLLLRMAEISASKPADDFYTGKIAAAKHFVNVVLDRKSTRLNSSHIPLSRMPSSA